MSRTSLLLSLLFLFFSQSIAQTCDSLEGYDLPAWQLKMLGIDELHANGYTGKGVRIAVLDNGFLNADQIEVFKNMNVIYQKDLVENDDDVFGPCDGSCTHGTRVLSVMAAVGSDFRGAAPDAEYLLFRTEDDRGESKMEEKYWAEAAVLADSMGADIITSSLGYIDFDDGSAYAKEDLDGRTAISTRGAQRAAKAGILVVTSAGNEGDGGITAPADADSILAVGAITQDYDLAGFSSRGPSGDGRIKPDIVAQGQSVYNFNTSGEPGRGNGTSFAAPLMAGLGACLWQAMEEQGLEPDAQKIRSAIIGSADRASNPNNDVGYGRPDGEKAFEILTGETLIVNAPCDRSFGSEEAFIYPNPSSGDAFLTYRPFDDVEEIQVDIFDKSGKRLWSSSQAAYRGAIQSMRLPVLGNPGQFLVRVSDKRGRRIAGMVWIRQ